MNKQSFNFPVGKILPATHVMVFYSNDVSMYAELAHVRKDGTTGPLKPMLSEECMELGNMLVTRNSSFIIGRIPDNLHYAAFENNTPCVVWSTDIEIQQLFFAKNLNIPNGYIQVPKLLWCYYRKMLYLYSYTDKALHDDTVLYHAPFHNVYSNGSVCLGSGTKFIEENVSHVRSLIEQVEEAFYKSVFTHLHHTTTVSNLNLLLQQLIKPTRKEALAFPEQELVKAGKTMRDVYHQIN